MDKILLFRLGFAKYETCSPSQHNPPLTLNLDPPRLSAHKMSLFTPGKPITISSPIGSLRLHALFTQYSENKILTILYCFVSIRNIV